MNTTKWITQRWLRKSITIIRRIRRYIIYCQRAKQNILTIYRCVMNYIRWTTDTWRTQFPLQAKWLHTNCNSKVMKIPIPIYRALFKRQHYCKMCYLWCSPILMAHINKHEYKAKNKDIDIFLKLFRLNINCITSLYQHSYIHFII